MAQVTSLITNDAVKKSTYSLITSDAVKTFFSGAIGFVTMNAVDRHYLRQIIIDTEKKNKEADDIKQESIKVLEEVRIELKKLKNVGWW